MIYCHICKSPTKFLFESKVLKTINVLYSQCKYCGYIQTSKPNWLKVAYSEALNSLDTGAIRRNLVQSNTTAGIINKYFKPQGKFVDFAGGYGVFTRMMRDLGYDFYWSDKYAKNLFSRGFEYTNQKPIQLITSFESFEHFVDPINEIKNMLSISKSILFSTELYKGATPSKDWWYWGFEHGQHISFYSKITLEHIAKMFSLNLYTDNSNLHLLTKNEFSIKAGMLGKDDFTMKEKMGNVLMQQVKKMFLNHDIPLPSKTMPDHLYLKKRMK